MLCTINTDSVIKYSQAKSFFRSTQEITILWNREAHYSNQKSLSLVSILSQMNPINSPHISSTLSIPHKLITLACHTCIKTDTVEDIRSMLITKQGTSVNRRHQALHTNVYSKEQALKLSTSVALSW
jgi:hypothetical protein